MYLARGVGSINDSNDYNIASREKLRDSGAEKASNY